MKSEKVRYNFGTKGWIIILYSILLLYFMTGMTVDGLNAIVPGIANLRGWDHHTILSISTPASIIALILTMFFGLFIQRFGLKRVTTITMVLASACMIWYGNATSIVSYAISLTLMITFVNGFSTICGFSIIANWFPKKKGVVLGFTTMGMNLASASIVIVLTFFSKLFSANPMGNISHSITAIGVIILIVAILTHFFIKVTPEEAGLYPDNEVNEDLNDPAVAEGGVPLTYREVLMMPKTWLIGIGYGANGMATVGIMSQLVPFFMTRGFEQKEAIGTLTIAAIIGLVGSYLWGVVDQKIGTRRTSIIFGIWYCIGIIILTSKMPILMYSGLFMLGMGIGGNGNFPPSMTTTVFGRKDFAVAFSVINTIIGVIRSMSFVVLAIILKQTNGEFEIAYWVFGGVALISALCLYMVKTHIYENDK